MCGRYTFVETGKLWERFGVEGAQLVPRYNVAPTQEMPVITGSEKRRLIQMRWGLVPHWAKEISIGSRMINARGETVEEKPSFRSSFRHKRCLVPADGFFEWQRQNGLKVPYRFTLANGGLFAMAGLWDRWISPNGDEIQTFTIITTTANELVGTVHDRMPVILSRENEQLWLEGKDAKHLKQLLVPYPAEQMSCYQVSQLCNSAKNDLPECILPA
ncbi:SOS response-associated peptidase [Dethiobacter alkaliphilus]|uniref:SOS response-associated peptidase n=1 Tax=Dethiobacter alkaliphilus TaxID=427926 RepID=UPI0037BF3DA4